MAKIRDIGVVKTRELKFMYDGRKFSYYYLGESKNLIVVRFLDSDIPLTKDAYLPKKVMENKSLLDDRLRLIAYKLIRDYNNLQMNVPGEELA